MVAGCGSGTPASGIFQNKVTVEDGTSALELMQMLQPGLLVDLNFAVLELTQTVRVDVENVRIRGNPDGPKPIIKCPHAAPAFEIR